MPHAVLTGDLEIHSVFEKMERISVRDGVSVLKTGALYLARDNSALIIESTVIENGKALDFFVLVNRRADGIVIRLHPSLDVPKTDGIKQLLALVAENIIKANPGTAVAKTNLQAFLRT